MPCYSDMFGMRAHTHAMHTPCTGTCFLHMPGMLTNLWDVPHFKTLPNSIVYNAYHRIVRDSKVGPITETLSIYSSDFVNFL